MVEPDSAGFVGRGDGYVRVGPAGHEVQFGAPKTRAGQRRVDLDEGTIAVLRGVRRRQAEERLAWGPAYEDTGLVFTHEDGRGVHPEVITKTFRRLAQRAGVRVVRLHDLRHGSASLQLAAGVDLAVVSKRLGHSTLTLTSDTYSHLIGGVGRDAAERTRALVPRVGQAAQ